MKKMNILKSIMAAVAGIIGTSTLLAGAPPTVMVLPDKTWCNESGYVTKSERNGKTRVTENYDEAFLNSDLKNVVVNLNDLLKTAGLPPKDYTATSETDDDEESEEEMFEGAQSGSGLAENSYEAMLNKLKPDIILKIGWNVNKVGFDYNVSYRLEAIDSYTSKSIAAVTGETALCKVTVPLAATIKNAATEHMGDFVSKLQAHFDDLQTNGREVTVSLRIIDNGDAINFNSEFNGKELNEIIHDWLNDNTVNHVFSERNATRNRLQYEQVRIPFRDSAGKNMQARQFVAQLQKYLKSNFGIVAENTTKGLGGGRLYIGEK
jgi:hypothetical protein